jgi:hypothetical protein
VLAADMSGGLYSFRLEDPGVVRGRRLSLVLRYRAGRRHGRRCARSEVTASLRGPDVRQVRRVDFLVGDRRVARDRRSPFSARVRRSALQRARANRIHARVVPRSGERITLSRTVRAC